MSSETNLSASDFKKTYTSTTAGLVLIAHWKQYSSSSPPQGQQLRTMKS